MRRRLYAGRKTSIGGNPAPSFLDITEYGYEPSATVKWFANRNTYGHGHIADSLPGDATTVALGGDADNWLSAMLFVRYAS